MWKPGVVIPKETDYNRAYIRSQQQAGNLMIFNKIYDIEWVSGENTKETAEGSGLSSFTRRPIYGINITFKKGLYSQKQFDSVSFNSYWNVQLMDGDGNELWCTTNDGDFVGLSTSYVVAMPLQLKNGAVAQKTGLEIEFAISNQIDARFPVTIGQLGAVGIVSTTSFLPSISSGP